MTQTLELPFEFSYTNPTHEKRLWSLCPPFNSGTWTFRYDSSTRQASIECRDVPDSVVVESVKLTAAYRGGQPYERSTCSGLQKASFPPSQAWSLTCGFNSQGHNHYGLTACVAKLVVQYSDNAAKCTYQAQQKVEAEQVASRSASKYNAYRLSECASERLSVLSLQ